MNIKKVVEKLKTEKEDADAQKPPVDLAGLSAYAWELLGKAERGELPPSNRRGDEARSPERVEFDAHIDLIASRIKDAPPAPEPVSVSKDAKTADVEPENELGAMDYFLWLRDRYKIKV